MKIIAHHVFIVFLHYEQMLQMTALSMRSVRSHGMFYLAAAVSDFYVPWKSMVIIENIFSFTISFWFLYTLVNLILALRKLPQKRFFDMGTSWKSLHGFDNFEVWRRHSEKFVLYIWKINLFLKIKSYLVWFEGVTWNGWRVSLIAILLGKPRMKNKSRTR